MPVNLLLWSKWTRWPKAFLKPLVWGVIGELIQIQPVASAIAPSQNGLWLLTSRHGLDCKPDLFSHPSGITSLSLQFHQKIISESIYRCSSSKDIQMCSLRQNHIVIRRVQVYFKFCQKVVCKLSKKPTLVLGAAALAGWPWCPEARRAESAPWSAARVQLTSPPQKRWGNVPCSAPDDLFFQWSVQ